VGRVQPVVVRRAWRGTEAKKAHHGKKRKSQKSTERPGWSPRFYGQEDHGGLIFKSGKMPKGVTQNPQTQKKKKTNKKTHKKTKKKKKNKKKHKKHHKKHRTNSHRRTEVERLSPNRERRSTDCDVFLPSKKGKRFRRIGSERGRARLRSSIR